MLLEGKENIFAFTLFFVLDAGKLNQLDVCTASLFIALKDFKSAEAVSLTRKAYKDGECACFLSLICNKLLIKGHRQGFMHHLSDQSFLFVFYSY